MKAVLLAGGLGTRMGSESTLRPKPMVEVGGKPILWHIMKILSHAGIKEFIICAGYKAEYISNYFVNYARINADFTVKLGEKTSVTYHGDWHDEADWTVTVANTGRDTMTGGRVKRIRDYVGDEPFFCTYGDGIASVDIENLVKFHETHGQIATLTATRPWSRFGVVEFGQDGLVSSFREKPQGGDWVNIGYFIFQPEVFDYIAGDDTILEQEPLRDLVADRQVSAFKHDGFWLPMDTQRESQILNDLWDKGAPWKVWE